MMWQQLLSELGSDLGVKAAAVLLAGHVASASAFRASSATRHLILSVAMISVLALPLLGMVLPGVSVRPVWETHPVPSAAVTHVAKSSRVATVENDPAQSIAPTRGATRVPMVAGDSLAPGPSAGLDAGDWLGLAWATGAAAALLPLILAVWSLRRLERRSARITTPGWVAQLERCAQQIGTPADVVLLRGGPGVMPMTWGIRRPRLLLPAEADRWPMTRRRAVLLHELAHIRRRDALTHLLTHLTCVLHWYNPLAWWALHRMRGLREAACDDAVIMTLGVERISDYAQHLLDVASGVRKSGHSACVSIAMARPSAIEERMRAILDPGRSRRAVSHRLLTGIILLAALGVGPLAAMRAEEPAPADAPGDASPESGEWSATLDGVTVTLIGLAAHPSERGIWWKPDGALLESPPYDRLDGSFRSDGRLYEVAFAIDSPPDATSRLTVPEAQATYGAPAIRDGRQVRGLLTMGFGVSEDDSRRDITFQVHVANLPWRTINTIDGTGGMAVSGSRREDNVAMAAAIEHGGGTRVTAAIGTPADHEVRLVAIDQSNREYPPTSQSGASAGGVRQITADFTGLTLDQIKGFRHQTRPYRVVTFRNVSLRQGRHADVEVLLAGEHGSGRPGAGTPAAGPDVHAD